MSILSSNLKLLREEARLSIEELSDRTKINSDILARFEDGTLIPNEYQLEVLCIELHMPYEDISVRDLAEERKVATKEMKNKDNRNNYDWYFGNKKMLILFISYFVFFLISVSLITLFSYYIITSDVFQYNISLFNTNISPVDKFRLFFNLIYYWFWEIKIVLIIVGIIVIVFFCLYYFSYHTFVFRYWYIFLIGIFITLIPFIGIFGLIALFIFFLIKLIKGRF